MTAPVDNRSEHHVLPYPQAMPAQLLTVQDVAEQLHVTPDVALELIRKHAPVGTIRTNDRRFLLPAERLPDLREAAGIPARPGPRRTMLLTEQETAELYGRARAALAQIEDHRAAMSQAAGERAAAVLALHEGGLSVRNIAAGLQVSAAAVQTAIAEGRRRRS